MSGKKRSLCPECGKHASGNFCQHCGSSLGGKFCNECGAEMPPGGGFCNQCGTPTASRRSQRTRAPSAVAAQPTDLSWWIAGAAAFALVVVVGWNMVPTPGPVQPAGAAVPTPPAPMDFSSMSPRQTADELFNRAMTANETGDTAQARQFMPMALQAYEAARPLDLDGLFHLALIHRAIGDFEASLNTALQMLEAEPNHILALEVAAQATLSMGRDDEAEGYFRSILDNVDTEIVRPLTEYQGHSAYFGVARSAAEAFFAER